MLPLWKRYTTYIRYKVYFNSETVVWKRRDAPISVLPLPPQFLLNTRTLLECGVEVMDFYSLFCIFSGY